MVLNFQIQLAVWLRLWPDLEQTAVKRLQLIEIIGHDRLCSINSSLLNMMILLG